VPAVLLGLTASTFDLGPGPGRALRGGIVCFRASALGAVPVLIASAVLVARAFPLRPAIAGALYGLGCGLIADAGLRLFCGFSQPQHILLAHGGAMAASVAVGALAATVTASR